MSEKLKSERSWVRTNRLAGRMFVVAGVAVAAGGFLGFAVNVAVFLGLLLSVSVLTTVYSYVQWRKDPDGKTRSDVPFVRLGLSGREAAEEKSGAAPGRRRR
ncbi:MAG: SdpI family protein [Acidobacteria bacterium]|nr:SdpI family protein [Acidobacteriota bacterium]